MAGDHEPHQTRTVMCKSEGTLQFDIQTSAKSPNVPSNLVHTIEDESLVAIVQEASKKGGILIANLKLNSKNQMLMGEIPDNKVQQKAKQIQQKSSAIDTQFTPYARCSEDLTTNNTEVNVFTPNTFDLGSTSCFIGAPKSKKYSEKLQRKVLQKQEFEIEDEEAMMKDPRKDKYGNQIIKGSKRHRVSFADSRINNRSLIYKCKQSQVTQELAAY